MSHSIFIWVLVFAAVSAANLPFTSRRLLLVWPLRREKTLLVRLGELVAFYFGVGGLGLFLENRAGQIVTQSWEFYAITATAFLTFAFPGFVYRYLFKQRD